MKRAAPAGVGDVLRFAWPSVLSFVTGNAFRVNDQYWIGDLGPAAHAALSACTFVMILNFAVFFIAVAGCVSLLTRAVGGGRRQERDRIVQHALVLSGLIGAVLALLGWIAAPILADTMGLEPQPRAHAVQYLRGIYAGLVPMALAPMVDSLFIGMGNTLVPLLLQVLSVSCNFVLNPALIYGWLPGRALDTSTPWMGIEGAALATVISRSLAVVIGLILLSRVFDVKLWPGRRRLSLVRLREIVRIGLPSSLSIAFYALVYATLVALVFSELSGSTATLAALGIGFNAFEGVSYPFFLGVAVAGSSLVGRNLGAGDLPRLQQAIRNVRWVGAGLGVLFSLLFFFVGPHVVPLFSRDPDVIRETVLYVQVLAASQVFVALETVDDKVLLAAGQTRAIFWISVPLNGLRIPLAALLALNLGWGALGIWWTINLTSMAKSLCFRWRVNREDWRALRTLSP